MPLERFGDHTPHIDPQAFVHSSAVVIGRVRVGAESSVWPNVTMRGDDGPIVVGARSSVQDGTVVHMTEGRSPTIIGDQVTVGHNAIIHGCTIEDDCIIGMGAVILDDAVVERGCIVGAGALVPPGKRVPAGSVVVGNPFRVMRACTAQDTEFIAFSWQEYVQRTHQYRAATGT
ncbi:MAG: gamma carbonic anhydrase family protein [Deltaproteobacteria bacterium]|nr:gamma carbonic anhydrase family protein [Deltaproteobacteria bacterium]